MVEQRASRHLSSDYLKDYIAAGSTAVVVISGHPTTHLIIDPPRQRIGLEVEWDGSDVPDLSDYAHLDSAVVFHDGRDWSQLWILDPRILLDAYPMLCALADKVQDDNASMATAIPDVLTSYRRILEGAERLSPHEEVGLVGELMVLESLGKNLGLQAALDSWRGASDEEHDFAAASVDLEVKSTTAETRRHRIGSHTQLTPTPARQLVLLSIQLTTGVDQAETLRERIERIRGLLEDSARSQFNAQLERLGWRDAHAPQFYRRFSLRSTPAAFLVDETFPAITTERLIAAGLPVERLSCVSYEIDVTGLPGMQTPPAFLVGLLGIKSE